MLGCLAALGGALALDIVAGSLLDRFRPLPRDTRGGIPSGHYHHDLAPLRSVTAVWGSRQYAHVTNSLGFRDHMPREVALDSKRYRVVFLGDSFTEGLGCDQADTFPGRIERALGPDEIEVLNAGVMSYSPKLYLLKAKHLLSAGLRIDALHVLVDVSDVPDEIAYQTWNPGTVEEPGLISTRTLRRLSRWSLGCRFLVRRFRSAELPPDRLHWPYDDHAFATWRGGLELAQEHMRALAQECRRRGVAMAVVVYPYPEQLRRGSGGDRHFEAWSRFCAQEDIPLLDVFQAFAAERPWEECFIPGDAHWTPHGHEVVARAWLKRFAEPVRRAAEGR